MMESNSELFERSKDYSFISDGEEERRSRAADQLLGLFVPPPQHDATTPQRAGVDFSQESAINQAQFSEDTSTYACSTGVTAASPEASFGESRPQTPPFQSIDETDHFGTTPHARSSRPLFPSSKRTAEEIARYDTHRGYRIVAEEPLSRRIAKESPLDPLLGNEDETTALLTVMAGHEKVSKQEQSLDHQARRHPYHTYDAYKKREERAEIASHHDKPHAQTTSFDQTPLRAKLPYQRTSASATTARKAHVSSLYSPSTPAPLSHTSSKRYCLFGHLQPSTLAGAVMFLLYHVVFCLANASAIIRPKNHSLPEGNQQHQLHDNILGVMARLSTVGIIMAGPLLIYRLDRYVPALYPSMDLFLAPFLAQAAADVDEALTLRQQQRMHLSPASDGSNEQDRSMFEPYSLDLFLGSFVVLVAMGMFLAATLLQLAAKFKLASLGTYLPYSVLCGFFSAVGVLLWALAFSVDNGGLHWKTVLWSGDWTLMGNSMLHHLPTMVIGIVMHKLGPKNPFFVIVLIIVTLIGFYAVMWMFGTNLITAQEHGWFWSKEELVHTTSPIAATATSYEWLISWFLPPAPFDSIASLVQGYVDWYAVFSGLENMAAFALLYLLRSSIHASAMKKNVGNLVRRLPIRRSEHASASYNRVLSPLQEDKNSNSHLRATQMIDNLRQSVNILNLSLADRQSLRILHQDHELDDDNEMDFLTDESEQQACTEVRPRMPDVTLEEIFKEYSYALYLVAICGSFGICPTIATSNTMYAIGAEGPAPQYGSIVLLALVYFTSFNLVRYIPKTAFSALLVLGAVDTLVVWFIGAYRKMQDLTEWLVVPFIVAISLWIGFLKAILLGLALSTFVFVASFNRVGVVKFNATGMEIRSRIERTMAQSAWLDAHGDYIQIIVLQNYLFFGNASSVFNYIATMFEEVEDSSTQLDLPLPPIPKMLLIDMALITGMDTSTTDIFKDIRTLCLAHDCQLFLSGISQRMRAGLALGGIVPDKRIRGKRRMTQFFPDLDTALGRAEDLLIQNEMTEIHKTITRRSGVSGFEMALSQIDELLNGDFTDELLKLERHVVPLELKPGDRLFESDGGVVQNRSRGLFFIESGLLKIERDSNHSLTHTRTFSRTSSQQFTLKKEHARTGSIAIRASLAMAKGDLAHGMGRQNLRLARIGPGWVCGTYEHASGLRPSGITVAVTRCRLHHLPFSTLEQVEQEDPALILKLYKMLSHLMARREEITIEHMSTLHNIMSSPAHSKPLSRVALQALKR